MKEVYVMKTPWRFLADLISKRPAAEQVEDQTPRAEIKAIEYRPKQEEAVANPPTKEIRSEQASTEADAPRGVEADAAEYVSLESGQAQVDDVRSVSGEGQEGAVVAEASKTDNPAAEAAGESATTVPANGRVAGEVASISKRKPKWTDRNPEVQSKGNEREETASHSAKADGASLEPRSPFDTMLGLDDEIQDLRKRLAEKLAAQNEQLRQMLERYNR
jgi:hypothetical protein